MPSRKALAVAGVAGCVWLSSQRGRVLLEGRDVAPVPHVPRSLRVPRLLRRAGGNPRKSLSGALQSTDLWQLEPSPEAEETLPQAPKAQPFSADAVLRMASEGQSQRAGRWLETLLTRNFLELESMVNCFGALAVSYAREGNAGAAMRYLQRIRDVGGTPEAEIFRSLLEAFAEGEEPDPVKTESSLVLLQQMRRAGHAPDLDCCNAVLRSLGLRNSDPAAAARWMKNEMPQLGVEPDVGSIEILVEAYFLQGLRKGAASWLAQLRQPSMRLLAMFRDRLLQTDEGEDLRYYLNLPQLGGLRRSRQLVRRLLKKSSPAEAEAWLERCMGDGLEPDRSCFTRIATAWLSQGDAQRSALWFSRMVDAGHMKDEDTAAVLAEELKDDAGKPEAENATMVVLRLAQSGAVTAASTQLLNALAASEDVDGRAFEALLAALSTAGRAEEASEWFRRMIACGIEPGVKACCALVDAWGSRGEAPKAAELLEELEDQGRRLDRFAYTAAVAALADAGDCTRAEAWLNRAVARGYGADSAAYNALLKGLVRQRNFHSAEELLGTMRMERLLPNEITFTTILGGHAENGDEDQVKKWLETMKDSQVSPNEVTYEAIIGGLSKHSLQQAEAWFQKMKTEQFQPRVTTYNRLLAGCARARDLAAAQRWFKEMVQAKVKSDGVSYRTMMDVCAKVAAPQEALKYLRNMQQRMIKPNVVAWSSLLWACAAKGDSEALTLAKESLKEMKSNQRGAAQ